MVLMLAQETAREGLTAAEVIRDLPHDGAAFFIYALTAVSLWLIWQGSRTRESREEAHPGGHGQGEPPKAEMDESEEAPSVERR